MRKKVPAPGHCSPEALKLLGDYTMLRIVDALSESGLRFTDIRRALLDTNAPTLIDRLRRMAEAGLLNRAEAALDKRSVIYELSEQGRALIPVLREIQKFAARYYPARPAADGGRG